MIVLLYTIFFILGKTPVFLELFYHRFRFSRLGGRIGKQQMRSENSPPTDHKTKKTNTSTFEVEIQTEDFNFWYEHPGKISQSPKKSFPNQQPDRIITVSPHRHHSNKQGSRRNHENTDSNKLAPITLDFSDDGVCHVNDNNTTNSFCSTIAYGLKYFWQLFTEHFILIALAVAVIIAFCFPDIGTKASTYRLGYQNYGVIEFINNVMVFLVSGLTLKIEEMKTLWQHKYLIVYGLVMINFLTTLVAFGTQQIPFHTSEFATGLSIFVTVPTTLGVGVALTFASKGDVILSLFLTVASNMLGIITVPYLLKFYFSSNLVSDHVIFHHADNGSSNGASVVIDPTTLAYRLAMTVLVPTIVGLLIRKCSNTVVGITKEYREFFSMFSMANLMCMVWMSLSKAKDTVMNQDIEEILIVLAVNVGIHIFYLVVNYIITWQVPKFVCNSSSSGSNDAIASVPIKQMISLLIMASQKSSPVALSVIAIIAEDSDQQGLMTIPCILGQLSQIFMGYAYSRWLSRYVSRLEEEDARVDCDASNDEDDGGSSTKTIASSSTRRTRNSKIDSRITDGLPRDIPMHVYIDI